MTTPRPSKSEEVGRFAKLALALSTLLGLFFYGVLRFAYGIFYRKLGTTPEEVGLSYSDILSQSIVGLAGYLVWNAGVVLALTAITVGPWWALHRRKSSADQMKHPLERYVARIAAASCSVAALATLVLIPVVANSRADDIIGGFQTSPVAFGAFEVLPLRADPAVATSTSREMRPLLDQCVLYLGRSDGLVVLFDPNEQETIRVPTSSTAVRVLTWSIGLTTDEPPC